MVNFQDLIDDAKCYEAVRPMRDAPGSGRPHVRPWRVFHDAGGDCPETVARHERLQRDPVILRHALQILEQLGRSLEPILGPLG